MMILDFKNDDSNNPLQMRNYFKLTIHNDISGLASHVSMTSKHKQKRLATGTRNHSLEATLWFQASFRITEMLLDCPKIHYHLYKLLNQAIKVAENICTKNLQPLEIWHSWLVSSVSCSKFSMQQLRVNAPLATVTELASYAITSDFTARLIPITL